MKIYYYLYSIMLSKYNLIKLKRKFLLLRTFFPRKYFFKLILLFGSPRNFRRDFLTYNNINNMKFRSLISNRLSKKYNVYISPGAILDDSIEFPHPMNIVIGWGVHIEKNVTIYQGVTLGIKSKDHWNSSSQQIYYPTIYENSVIYPNAVIVGNVFVNISNIISPNSVVIKNTDEFSIYSGNPAKKIGVKYEQL